MMFVPHGPVGDRYGDVAFVVEFLCGVQLD
jgi:hypothetical protein